MLTVPSVDIEVGDARRPFAAIRGVVRASRVHKLIPLLLLMTNAALFAGESLPLLPGIASALFVLSFSMLGMQLNVLTDAELDRATKPELLRALSADQRVLRSVMWGEAIACIAFLAVAGAQDAGLGVALVAYAVCFALYSYNFVVGGANAQARLRLKVFWWGNLLTVVGGYFSLWAAGFALGGLQAASWPLWSGIAVAVCAVDYGVFLNECAGDAEAERKARLATLPALLGQRWTSGIAMTILIGGAAVAAVLLAYASHAAEPTGAVRSLALLWHVAVQATSAACTLLLVRRGRRRWEVVVDSSFWVSRAGALGILIGGM
jgi:4-hydroxybenzoate polyprenyltransferase